MGYYLPTLIKGEYFKLYLVLDIYSRYITGWEIHETESAELASQLIEKIAIKENINRDELTLHSDNGSPMKGYTMKAKLEQLGIIASYSRPAVSNDNAFSESLFGSMKTRKQYPRQGFKDIEEAREWVLSFVYWYNNEHRHSGIKYVTPAQRHQGIDGDILAKRKEVYRLAKLTYPERWNTRDTRDWNYEDKIVFNPVKENDANNSKKIGQVA